MPCLDLTHEIRVEFGERLESDQETECDDKGSHGVVRAMRPNIGVGRIENLFGGLSWFSLAATVNPGFEVVERFSMDIPEQLLPNPKWHLREHRREV